MDTEIKLLLTPAGRAAVEAHPLFAAAPARRVHNATTYYDTPDLALRARGAVLRVRQVGDRWVQTVKGAGGSFASRGEWEWPLASAALDPAAVEGEPEAARIIGDHLARVAPVFVSDVERDLRTLRLDGDTAVEAAIDSGEVRAGDRHARLSELELELKGGPLLPLLRLAAELSRLGDLRLGTDSKGERGYGLLTDALLPRPDAPDLAGRATLEEAFRSMFEAGARDLAADLSSAARGDVEGVHRLRAAIRRIRTLLALFRPHLEPKAAAAFDGELRDFGRLLGAGRDWDVFITETLVDVERDLGAETAAALRRSAEARRLTAREAVRRAVEGLGPTRLLLGMAMWTAGSSWLKHGRDGRVPFRDLLPGLFDRLERKALKKGRRIGSSSDVDLHALRKSLKKLRYASEDVASLFERDAVRPYVERVKKVLGDLGRINDAAVTEDLLRDLGADGRGPPAAALLEWTARRRRGSRRDLRRRWRKLRHADPFWA